MVSDILTAIIVLLMAVLVVYPTTRVVLQSWRNWRRRQGQKAEMASRPEGSAPARAGTTARADASGRRRAAAPSVGGRAPPPRGQRRGGSQSG